MSSPAESNKGGDEALMRVRRGDVYGIAEFYGNSETPQGV